MDATIQATGQNDASFFYPAVTDTELADPDQIVVGYRRCMGRVRILSALTIAVSAMWLADYVINGPRKKAH